MAVKNDRALLDWLLARRTLHRDGLLPGKISMKAKCEECGELGDLKPLEAMPEQGFCLCKWCSHVTHLEMEKGIKIDHMINDPKFLDEIK